MPVRKQIQQPSSGPQHAIVSDEESPYSSQPANSSEQQPLFLTLEETTTAADASSSMQMIASSTSDDGTRKRSTVLQQAPSSSQNANVTAAAPLQYSSDTEDHSHSQQQQPWEDEEVAALLESDKDSNDKERRKAVVTAGTKPKTKTSMCSLKKVIQYAMFAVISLIVWDALFTPPERRWIQPTHTDVILEWVQNHPAKGIFLLVVVIAAAVVVLIPIGTPLTLGCGYIYKGAYGWKLGLTLATLVSMGGSALGAVTCFLLGRYLYRDQVREWARNKYPLFDAIDVAASEHGLKIMAMLYLTPILPLGPVSYMCGTTSMALSSFVIAKIASLPLMLLYCFIGASMRTLLLSGNGNDEMKSIEENETLIVSGILMSFVMIGGITTYIRKELNKILERQGKHKPGEKTEPAISSGDTDDTEHEQAAIEMGHTQTKARRRAA